MVSPELENEWRQVVSADLVLPLLYDFVEDRFLLGAQRNRTGGANDLECGDDARDGWVAARQRA